MGHWSESLVDDLARQVGGDADPEELRRILRKSAQEIETLSGRTFDPVQRSTAVFETNGLPFIEVPNMHLGSMETTDTVWQVPDPVRPEFAAVLQVRALAYPSPTAMSVADGLGFAGQLVAHAARQGALTRDYVIEWLGTFVGYEERKDLFRRVMDSNTRFNVPVIGEAIGGWWIQVTRRLMWITHETQNDGRLVEPLFERSADDSWIPLAAAEPTLIVAPMTKQPADWAFTARIWPEGAQLPKDRPWRRLASAIHGSGIPTITVDDKSTPYELACQVVLKAYWHGYLRGDEPALRNVVALAYPKQVGLIHRKTDAPDAGSAAAMLLEQLIQPGFDPAQGAELTRRYVRRKARIVVMEHHKRESPQRYPWTQLGISERRYYKLLPLFAQKVNGHYQVDYDDIVTRMRDYLDSKDQSQEVRAATLDLLQQRGFSHAAARKWMQRHQPEEALDAWPRGLRPKPQ
ncbi:hypothetical protein [Micromonospora deserti]|uniref:hypothetical protein n=1 Tax=Micromonospora deserti TaxID=2070366 RepID=UPI0011B8259F|nr:hypothetical protein [Micromonospora deserti]